MSKESKDLLQVVCNQLFWKNEDMRRVSCAILQHALSQYTFYNDEIDFSFVGENDKNCIGGCFHLLKKYGIIKQTGNYRGSNAVDANHRVIFEWQIDNRNLAQSVLNRFGALVMAASQLELI